jgi:hypothetical protein
MLHSEWVNFHPLHNVASTTLRSADLVRFIRSLGYELIVVLLPEVPADEELRRYLEPTLPITSCPGG